MNWLFLDIYFYPVIHERFSVNLKKNLKTISIHFEQNILAKHWIVQVKSNSVLNDPGSVGLKKHLNAEILECRGHLQNTMAQRLRSRIRRVFMGNSLEEGTILKRK